MYLSRLREMKSVESDFEVNAVFNGEPVEATEKIM